MTIHKTSLSVTRNLFKAAHLFWRALITSAVTAFFCIKSNAALVAINEIHYDNAGSDIDEGVELVGISGTDLSDWTLALYNGSDQAPYRSIDLSTIIASEDGGFWLWHIPVSSMQNGSSDGIALIDASQTVLEFLSYEGSLTATSGPASGLSSVDIEISENSSTPIGTSLQRQGNILNVGGQITFESGLWATDVSSWGALNASQIASQASVPLPGSFWLMLSAMCVFKSRKLNFNYLQKLK